MVLSVRERYVAIAAAVVVGVAALYWVVIGPLLDRRDEAQTRLSALRSRLQRAQDLEDLSKRLSPRWQDMVKTGLHSDVDAAEGQVLKTMAAWQTAERIELQQKPERIADSKSRLPQVSIQFTTGTKNAGIEAIRNLLWRVQTASIPIKVTDLSVTSAEEGSDKLRFTMHVSTIYTPGQAGPTTAVAGAARPSPSGEKR